MSNNRTSMPADRIPQLEVQVSNLATTFDAFIKDSEQHRKRIEQDQGAIWSAIRDQGIQLREFVEKLSTKGQISWPGIITTVLFVLALVSSAAGIGNLIMEGRLRELKAQDENNRRERRLEVQAARDISEIRDAALRERLDRIENNPRG